MDTKTYFEHLYKIASHLNKAFSLHTALKDALQQTAELLDMESGWIWLTEPDNQSVYLASTYNLPPALHDFPERLSGWCYCIKQYLSGEIEEAVNISEIACSRLKDITSGTNGLKYHATIPITIKGEKVGLINLLSKETRQLNEPELILLNTIGELVGTAVQRTRLQQNTDEGSDHFHTSFKKLLDKSISPKISEAITVLRSDDDDHAKVDRTLQTLNSLQEQLKSLIKESSTQTPNGGASSFRYPELPITKREMEVLRLIKVGRTNDEIGKQLYITESTVKFHITAILSKFNAKNRTEAVDIALKRGLFNA